MMLTHKVANATRVNGLAQVVIGEVRTLDEGCNWMAFPIWPSMPLQRTARSRGISPTGHEWGYGGSGPHALALDLLEQTGEPGRADPSFVHEFKRQFVGTRRAEGFTVRMCDIVQWMRDRDVIEAAPILTTIGADTPWADERLRAMTPGQRFVLGLMLHNRDLAPLQDWLWEQDLDTGLWCKVAVVAAPEGWKL